LVRGTLRQPRLENLQASQERQPIGILPALRGRFSHQAARYVVTDRQSIDLLHHPQWRLAPEMRRLGRSRRCQVRLLLVKGKLYFPSFMVEKDEFLSRILLGIQQGGQQDVLLAAID